MPLFKNLKKEVCQVLEPEVAAIVKAGWKELTVKEEELYRAGLVVDHELTSAVAIEAARVKAGLYDVILGVAEKVATTTKAASVKAKSNATK